jgi:hypothetical protein
MTASILTPSRTSGQQQNWRDLPLEGLWQPQCTHIRRYQSNYEHVPNGFAKCLFRAPEAEQQFQKASTDKRRKAEKK